jgi:hypothetical protein
MIRATCEQSRGESIVSDDLTNGDKIEWNTPQGKTTGTVVKKLAVENEIKGHHVAASKDTPEYLVESDQTGTQAAHHPAALKKVDTGG